MTFKTSTLRPGFLVSLKTSTTGNVRYFKTDIETDRQRADGAIEARWETQRVIEDAAEHERAQQTRSKIRNIVGRVCSNSDFGLLCPEDRADELTTVIAEARSMADEFNAGSKVTALRVYIMAGKFASNDVEAMRAINSEVRDLLRDMENGISNLEVKQIRDAANRARGLAAMLTADAQTRVQMSIDAARSAATKIAQATKDGETVTVDRRALTTIKESHAMFLDLDDTREVQQPKSKARKVDLDPSVATASEEYVTKARAEKKGKRSPILELE